MQDEFPSISMEPFGIVIAPCGPVEPRFLNLDQAIDSARRLAQTGLTIQAITQGLEIVLEGSELDAALGETRPEFDGLGARQGYACVARAALPCGHGE